MSVEELYDRFVKIENGKEIFYDWDGGNVWLFKQVNSLHENTYDTVMVWLSRMADYHMFPYYIVAVLAYALVTFAIRKATGRAGNKYYLSMWIGILAVLCIGFGANAVVIKPLKAHFAYQRPYAALPASEVRVLGDRPADDSSHSFPSGHAAFITLMVVGLWPALSRHMRYLCSLLIFLVAWSRLALGMHFPADVLGGFLITFMLVLIIRAVLYAVLRKCFRITC